MHLPKYLHNQILMRIATLVGCVTGVMLTTAQAADYPVKPITLVVGFPPGGSTDKLARILAQAMQRSLGQQVVVDNRAGAAGNIAAQYVAQSPPNGYTLFMATLSSQAINPWIYDNTRFDPINDFTPVALVAAYPLVMVVAPNFPANSVREALKYIAENPGKIFFASAGQGSPGHLSGELLKTAGKLSMTHVPYKGGAQAMVAVMSGEAAVAIETIPAMVPLINSGRLKGLAVTSSERSAALPNLPTLAESGLTGFNLTSWSGVVVPARTPPQIRQKLEQAIASALRDPVVRSALHADGAEVRFVSGDDFRRFQERESAKWKGIVRLAELRRQ